MKLRFRVTQLNSNLLVTIWSDGAINGELVFTPSEWAKFRTFTTIGCQTMVPPIQLVIEET